MADERAISLHKFVRPSYSCEIGPEIEHVPGRLTLRYDSESRNGGRDWTRVDFEGVIASQFTPEPCTTVLMVEAYDCICEVQNSAWLACLGARAEAGHEMISPDRRHFMIFFDHVGCLEVIASSFEVRDEPGA